METININSEELNEMKQLGRGACSIVYKYGTDLVIKVLNEKGIQLHNEDEFSNLVGIENGTCIFPKNKVNIDGKFQAYTMEYVSDLQLQDIIKNMNISTLSTAIEKVEDDLKKLSTDKILFQDLNQGGIMWDEKKECIKIIDTDFFEKNEDIDEKQCYSANINSLNSMLEMELGILNGQGTKLSEYLQSNQEFSKLYSKYMIYSLNGKNMSINELLNKAVEIFENDFGIKPNNVAEMEQLANEKLGKKDIQDNTMTIQDEIPVFQPPNNEQNQSNTQDKIGIKQRIVNFLADKPLLRKIPFIERFVSKEQRLLPEKTLTIEEMTKQDQHSKFVDEISGNGKYRKFLGQTIKSTVIETAKQKYGELHAMTDKDKIEQMKKKMDGKSLEDDL